MPPSLPEPRAWSGVVILRQVVRSPHENAVPGGGPGGAGGVGGGGGDGGGDAHTGQTRLVLTVKTYVHDAVFTTSTSSSAVRVGSQKYFTVVERCLELGEQLVVEPPV